MSIINFTVEYDLFTNQTDSSDSGIDVDQIALIGTVTFTPQTLDNKAILAPTYDPRPSGFKMSVITGYLDTDGRLKSAPSGTVGVRLWANDPVLELERLTYQVTFNLTTPIGEKIKVEGGYFEAPATDTVLNLADVLESTGFASITTPGSLTVFGQNLISSASPEEARDTLHAVSDFDPRLDDTRTPPDGSVTLAKLNSTFANTVVRTDVSGSSINAPKINSIKDVNGNSLLSFTATSNAVNYVTLANSATGAPPTLYSSGSDDNVGLTYLPKGSGRFTIFTTTGNTPTLAASSVDTNADLSIVTKGSGVVKVNTYRVVDESLRNAVNGFCGLDSGGKVASAQLPSYVDDVLESANLAAFPATGTSGIIYIAADTGRSYRWTGSVYAEIVASPGTTDNITEGSTNLWFTNARADARVPAATAAASSKTTPVDGDGLPLVDSAASNALKRLTWANLKAAVKSYYDDVTAALTNKDLTSATNTFPTFNQNTTGNAATATNLVASTTTAVQLGTVEIGHATDTTLARIASGRVSVEGVELVRRTVQTVSTSVTLGSTGDYVVLIGSGGSIVLPTAVSNGSLYTIKNTDTATKTLSTTSSQTIDGFTTVTLASKATVDLVSDGSNWVTVTAGLKARNAAGTLEISGGYWMIDEEASDLYIGQESIQRALITGSTSPASGYSRMTMFTARKTETTTRVRFICTTAASGGSTGVTALYVALYTVNNDASLTRVALSVNSTAAATSTGVKTIDWDASYQMVAGQRYAISIGAKYDSTTAPQFLASLPQTGGTTEFAASRPAKCANLAATNGIPETSYTAATIDASTSNAHPYFVILPAA